MRRYLIIDDRSDDPERLRKILLEEGYGVSESPGWPGFLTGETGSRTPFPVHPAAGRENPDQADRTLPPDSSGHADAGNSPGRTEGWPGRYLPEAALLMRACDSVILEINGAFEQLTGYGRQEIVGQSALGLFFFLNPERWSQAFRTLRATGEVRELETRIVRKDRQVAFVLMSLQSTGAAGINCHQATIRDITELKTGEKSALLEQGSPEPGLESLLSPGMDINRENIGQLIDFEALQDLMNSFYKTTKIGIGINDIKGNVQVATGWQDICTCFHRVHPETLAHCIESDIHLSQSIGEGKYSLYKCRNNLWDIATPLIIGGRHIANIFLGQFFFDDEVPDYDLFRKQAELYGFNADEYLAALERVPRWSRETVENVMEFYTKLAVMISRLSLGNIRLARTLAEQERVKEALGISEQNYRAIIENAPFGIFRSTVEGKFISVNPTLAAMLGYDSPEDLLQACNNSTIHDRLYIDPEVRNAMVESVLREGGWQVRQNSYRRKNGSIITGNIYMRATPDSGGKGIELEGFVEDITERKRAEESIRAALAEKELLLKEVHHRVKNNLQVISTLLDLQADNIHDENLLNALKVSQDRIKAMSLIHERLYQSSDLVRIDFWEYIESLVGHLLSSYVDDPRRIVMKVDVGDFQMGIDRAIPCGLIINELVSNAMKHAFPNGRNGEIAIRLHADDSDWITLTVADDGVGVPHGLDLSKTETLGLQLVNMLAKQLRGQIDMSSDHGTLWVISFSKLDNSKSASA